jgi:hypothetical protein
MIGLNKNAYHLETVLDVIESLPSGLVNQHAAQLSCGMTGASR